MAGRALSGTGDGPVADVGDAPPTCSGTCGRRSDRSPCTRPASCSRSRTAPAIRISPDSTTRPRPIAGWRRQRRRAAAAGVADARPPHVSEGTADARLAGRRRERRRARRTTSSTAARARRRWKTLREDVTEPILVWDTTTVPNGTYFVRIVASDAPSNSLQTALAGELDSMRVRGRQHARHVHGRQRPRVDGAAHDRHLRRHATITRRSRGSSARRTVSSGWQSVFPVDGIADSRSEHYELAIDGPIGPRGLTLRATDAMNNVSTSQVDAPAADR